MAQMQFQIVFQNYDSTDFTDDVFCSCHKSDRITSGI